MTLVAFGLAIASRYTRTEEWVAFTAILAASCGAVAAALALGSAWGWLPSPSGLVLASAGVGLVLVGLGDLNGSQTVGWRAVYRRPLLASTFLAVGLTWLFGGWAWHDSHALSASLALTALTLTLAVRQTPIRPVPDLAIASGLAAWLVGWGALGSLDLAALPRDGQLVLLYLLAVLAVAEVLRRLPPGMQAVAVRDVFVTAMPEFAAVAAVAALGDGGRRALVQ